MKKNYYIQVGSGAYKNIWDEYGIYVAETEGLNMLPSAKKLFSRDWPEEQGLDIHYPDDIMFKSRDVKITFKIVKSETSDAMSAIKLFRNELFSAGDFSYFDTYKNNGFRGHYEKDSVNTEVYREYSNYIEFEMNFVAPNGISFGYDNTGGFGIDLTVSKGYCDLYFSDGTKELNVEDYFLKDIEGGFVIVNPSIYNNLTVSSLGISIFLTRDEEVFLTRDEEVFLQII